MRRRWTERARAAWRWGRKNRYTLADVGYALGSLPFVVAGMVISLNGDVGWGLDALLDGMAVLSPITGLFLGLQLVLVVPGLVALAVLARRTSPQWLLWSSLLLTAAFGNVYAAPVALYSYAAWFPDRRRLLLLWSCAHFAALTATYSGRESILVVPLTMSFLVFPLLFGLWVGTRRQLVENLRERAERLEREQHLMAESAIAAERTRIAREMHDVVAHRVSLMVLHAGGLEVSAPDERTAKAAELIRTTGREALAELREILGVLRDGGDTAPTAPQPVLDDLGKLVDNARAAGMTVVLSATGTPRRLPAQVERTAYRVVQEALTNAAKHAPGAPVDVHVDHGDRELTLTVANAAATDTTADPVPGSGYGLVGLRERLAMVGGTMVAYPLPDGGWWLRAAVPVPPASDTAGAEAADTVEEPQ
ncbi:sensor histidine kinase [Thermobifida halotolerans]|uniref:histidine kinase n=1 Tax=Thermobifida halotolerans TaxID=483545 RepID=A0AA97M0T7_9ACTN|nr:histidine kinase [Thermobifida halotolerans]UOE21618.1 sensor histidine kinase [Thermobifida halotolerans]